MKTRIAVGAALLLTIGSAVAGTLLYSQSRPAAPAMTVAAASEVVTPTMIANWKDSSRSFDYVAPKVPL